MSLPKVLQKIINNVGFGTELTGNDNDIVHKTGDEEITGQKVFNQPSLLIKDTLVDADDFPSSGISYTELFFVGNDHVLGTPLDNDPSRLGEIQHYKSSDGNRGIEMTVRWPENSGGQANIGLKRSSSGAVFGYCPSTPLPSVHNEGTDIVTRDFIPNDTRIVHTTGTQVVGGHKVFTSDPAAQATDLDFTKTQTGNTNAYLYFVDKNEVAGGCIQFHVTANDVQLRLMTRKIKDTSTATSSLPSVGFCHYNDGSLAFEPNTNGTVQLGTSGNGRWKDVWAANATIQTSDRRQKSDITTFSDEVLDAWENISFVQFKMNSAIESKGEKARIHAGIIAQDAEEAFSSANLDGFVYGFLCHDSWDAREAQYDQDGNLDTPARPAGDEYSVRYEEVLCIEAAYNRRRVSRLEEKIKLLEQKLNLAS